MPLPDTRHAGAPTPAPSAERAPLVPFAYLSARLQHLQEEAQALTARAQSDEPDVDDLARLMLLQEHAVALMQVGQELDTLPDNPLPPVRWTPEPPNPRVPTEGARLGRWRRGLQRLLGARRPTPTETDRQPPLTPAPRGYVMAWTPVWASGREFSRVDASTIGAIMDQELLEAPPAKASAHMLEDLSTRLWGFQALVLTPHAGLQEALIPLIAVPRIFGTGVATPAVPIDSPQWEEPWTQRNLGFLKGMLHPSLRQPQIFGATPDAPAWPREQMPTLIGPEEGWVRSRYDERTRGLRPPVVWRQPQLRAGRLLGQFTLDDMDAALRTITARVEATLQARVSRLAEHHTRMPSSRQPLAR